MEVLGKVSREKPRSFHRDSGSELISVNSAHLLAGEKKFSKKRVIEMLRRKKGRFECQGLFYRWYITDSETVSVDYYCDHTCIAPGTFILSSILLKKIRAWSKEKK